jgi:hypothetical protein
MFRLSYAIQPTSFNCFHNDQPDSKTDYPGHRWKIAAALAGLGDLVLKPLLNERFGPVISSGHFKPQTTIEIINPKALGCDVVVGPSSGLGPTHRMELCSDFARGERTAIRGVFRSHVSVRPGGLAAGVRRRPSDDYP